MQTSLLILSITSSCALTPLAAALVPQVSQRNPATGKVYHLDFPVLTVEHRQFKRSILAHLDVEQVHTVVGASMGAPAGYLLPDAS